MNVKLVWLAASMSTLWLAACSKTPAAPASPTTTAQFTAEANPDGTNLKVTPPVPVSPINGVKLDGATTDAITLVVNNSVSTFGVGLPVAYRFQLFNAAGVLLENSDVEPAGAVSTSHDVKVALEGDQTYSWWARPEVNQGQYVGSWSAKATFVAPSNEGYIRGNEVYDPLVNGKTVGAISGPVRFVPGVGLAIESLTSYVAYVLPQTLTQGEYSMLITGMPANTDGDKTKVFAMAEGFSDIVTNNRRMTIEKRGDPAGIVAWRVISHMLQIDTEGAEREFVDFQESRTYFFQATWRSNVFRLIVQEGGVGGRTIYNKAKNYDPGNVYGGNAYDPNPHVAYLGSPVGRSGETGASVNQMTIRQVWISSRPRPAFANR